jgi:hypothetical protein
MNWSDPNNFNIYENQLCPPYPECLTEDDVGYQDTSECSEIDFCDLNLDGNIDVLDIILVINCILQNGECDYICMDYNDDNEVNILDIILMVNIILEP